MPSKHAVDSSTLPGIIFFAVMKKVIFFLIFPLLFIPSCSKKIDARQTKKEISARKSYGVWTDYFNTVERLKKSAVSEFVNSLSLEERVSQVFIENLTGDTVFQPVEEVRAITENPDDTTPLVPGGYLFFSYNLASSPEKIMDFTDSIRDFCVERGITPPFLAIDQEGGFVNRLRAVSGPLPSQKRVADNLDVKNAYRLYALQAIQMHSLGFHLNMAPVAEALSPENESFLSDRSFGDRDTASLYSALCVNAYQNYGVGAVLKHFPGNSNTDPHTGLPEIRLSKEMLDEQLLPFKKCVGKNPAGVLMSHARTSCLDETVPACFSSKWITDELRQNYGFDGIVFSDDIFMGALNKNGYPPEKAVVMAIEAGVNCIMISEKRFGAVAKVLVKKAREDAAFSKMISQSAEKIIEFKIHAKILTLLQKDDGSGYVVAMNGSQQTLHDRLFYFTEARAENIDLYLERFY